MNQMISLPKYSFPPTTVVSVLPFPISEEKPGMSPSVFDIPRAPKGGISVLKVGGSIAPVKIDDDRGSIYVPQDAEKIANSIVQDFINATMCVELGLAEPGLFWLHGDLTPEEVMVSYSGELELCRTKHLNWCKRLVSEADDLWQRYRQHKSITDVMRYAAEELGFEDREWAKVMSARPISILNCPACGQECNKEAAVCHACRCILNEDKFRSLKFATEVKSSDVNLLSEE